MKTTRAKGDGWGRDQSRSQRGKDREENEEAKEEKRRGGYEGDDREEGRIECRWDTTSGKEDVHLTGW